MLGEIDLRARCADHAQAFERMTESWSDASSVALGYVPVTRAEARLKTLVWTAALAGAVLVSIALLLSWLSWRNGEKPHGAQSAGG
jgi:ferric-dicitrate binding protein FerR (iron transport regulator)